MAKTTSQGRSIITCSNCRDNAPTSGKGRCNACAQYFRTHGVERPADLIERARRRKQGLRLCRVCRQFKPVAGFHSGQWDCKPCQVVNNRAWRERHPDFVPLDRRDPEVRARYREVRKAWRRTPNGRASLRQDIERRRLRLQADPAYRTRRQEIMRRVKWKRGRRMRAQFVAPVDFDYIVRRDRGLCGICRKPVNLRLRYPHPMAASMDHIVPLSRGGTHEPRNVRLAHTCCNSRKWAKTGPHGDQLMLIG